MGKNVIISTLPNISQNYLPKVNTSNIFANSLVYDNGTSVMIDTTTTHSSFANARLVVNRTGNSYIEIRAISGQSALALTTGTSSASATPTVEFFNSGNFGIVAYRPGVVSSNYLMYYNLSSSTNRYLAIQTEGQDRITINQNGTIDLTGALSGTSATFTLANDITLTARSGAAGSYTYWSLGRTSSELELGVAAAANQFFTGTAAGDVIIKANGSSNKLMFGYGSGSPTLTLASTGAATFNGGVTIKSGNGDQLLLNNAGERFTQINFSNNTVSKANIWWDNTNTELVLLASGTGTGHLKIASTGAATFSSSVQIGTTPATAGSGLGIGLPFDTAIRWRNSTNTANLGFYLGGTNLFYFDAGISVNGAATFSSSVTSSYTYNGGGTGMLHLTSNGTEGGSVTFEKTSGTAQKYKAGNSGSAFFVYNETAGNQPFTILNNGNVLIGTTSDNGNKLRVAGNTYLGGFERIITYTLVVNANTTGTITITSPTGSYLQGTMMVTVGGYGNNVSGNVTGLWMASGLIFYNDPGTTTITQLANSVSFNGTLSFARSGANYTVTLVNTDLNFYKTIFVSVRITAD
jgi:hypothetical protein